MTGAAPPPPAARPPFPLAAAGAPGQYPATAQAAGGRPAAGPVAAESCPPVFCKPSPGAQPTVTGKPGAAAGPAAASACKRGVPLLPGPGWPTRCLSVINLAGSRAAARRPGPLPRCQCQSVPRIRSRAAAQTVLADMPGQSRSQWHSSLSDRGSDVGVIFYDSRQDSVVFKLCHKKRGFGRSLVPGRPSGT